MEKGYDYKRYIVLFVDDEQQMLKYFKMELEEDFRIMTASSALEAWRIAEEHAHEIGVVISDQIMPKEKGVDLLGRFKETHPQIVRILTTAYSDTEAAENSVNIGGAFRYIKKPWDDGELRGALLRAMEFFLLRKDRERLMKEKLSVVQRMVVLDRVRSLAVLAASLENRLKNPVAGFISYVEQSPLEKRIEMELADADELNIMSIFRTESENLIASVREAVSTTLDCSAEGETTFNLHEAVAQFVADNQAEKSEEGVQLSIESATAEASILGGRRGLQLVLSTLTDRICDMDGDDRTIRFAVSNDNSRPTIKIHADGPAWKNGQAASLFSAIMPLQKWPLGVDMDILTAFFVAANLGGEIRVHNTAPLGPGFEIRFGELNSNADLNADWFNRIFAIIERWREPAEV